MKKLLTIIAISFASSLFAQEQKVELNIPDVVINGTKLKRKAVASCMTYNLAYKSVSVSWKISYYSDSAGKYGSKLAINGVNDYTKETVANNTVMVDPADGSFVEADTAGHYPVGSIGQYDFFWNISENVPVKVNELIYQYGLNVKSEDW